MNREGSQKARHSRPRPTMKRPMPPRRPWGQAAQPLLFAGVTGLLAALVLPAGAQAASGQTTPGQNVAPYPRGAQGANGRGQQGTNGRSAQGLNGRDAQNMASPGQQPAIKLSQMASAAGNRISADSAPWHLEWNGASGTLTRRALGSDPEQTMSLLYAHTEPGPKGYSKYLTWFLARQNDHFSIAWCYLNDSGREFYCWLYEFPTNQLTTHRFVGDYRFAPLKEPVAPTVQDNVNYAALPLYTGPDFTYRNWTRRAGTLDSLSLTPTSPVSFANPTGGGALAGVASASLPASANTNARTLSGLRVSPLHEIHVAKGNGWRAGGWRELHAIAFDSANDPYYLILYSNVTKGYVVDLKRAQTYVADFGQRVEFASNGASFGANEDIIVGPPDLRIRRFARVEIPLATTTHYDNPYTQAIVDVEFRSPEGRTLRVPGFWDGGQTWRARFSPTLIGTWTWRTVANDTELDGQTGIFTCIADDTGSKGFLAVTGGQADNHGFTYTNGQPFIPSYLREPTFNAPVNALTITPAPAIPAPDPRAALLTTAPASLTLAQSAPGGEQASLLLAAQTPDSAQSPNGPQAAEAVQSVPHAFRDFTQRVDQAVTLGFNRFWGGYVVDPIQFAQHTQANEGGAPFMDYDLDRINPAFFQAMDQRIAYCNDRGVVPDIGLTDLSMAGASKIPAVQLSAAWRYVVARYASYNVCWNLFGIDPSRPLPAGAEGIVSTLALQTRRYDPNAHLITTVWPNAQPLAVNNPTKPPTGPVTFTPDRSSIVPAGPPPVFAPDPNFQFPPGTSGRGAFGGPQGQGRSRGTGGADTPSMPQTGNRSRGNGAGANGSGGNGSGANSTDRSAAGRNGTGSSATDRSGTNTGGTNGSGTGRSRTGRGGTDAGQPNSGATGAAGSGRGGTGASDPNGGRTGRGGNNRSASDTGANNPNASDPGAAFRNRFGQGAGRGNGTDFSGMGGFSRRGGSRRSRGVVPGADTNITEPSTDYITIADPGVSAEVRAERRALHPNETVTMQPAIPSAGAAWLDAITITGGVPASLEADYRLNKPLVLLDTTRPATPDEARYRLWETQMRGGYWANGISGDKSAAQPLDDQITQWQIACAHLFSLTKVGRLLPHQDMLGGPGESQFDRRRRRRSEAAAAQEVAAQKAASAAASAGDPGGGLDDGTGNPDPSPADGGYDETAPPKPAPVYVLADPGWEYVVYFKSGGTVTLDLLEATGTLRQSWYNPRTGQFASQSTIPGGVYKTFVAPDNKDWALYISRR